MFKNTNKKQVSCQESYLTSKETSKPPMVARSGNPLNSSGEPMLRDKVS
jgi:hypothetical protein